MKAVRQVLRMRHQITWHERIWEGEKKERDRDDDIGSEAFCVGDQPFNTSGYLLALHSV